MRKNLSAASFGSRIPVIVIVGPTASGKSGLAVEIARAIHGEIISADSRQVYRGLNIGTGKITKREMKGIRHHLLDVADPRIPANSPESFSVEKWKIQAERAIADIHSRGAIPIIAGGTGFYISALIDGMTFPDVPPNVHLRERLSKKDVADLFKMLEKLDPRRANDMKKNGDLKNKRRIIRAIEIAKFLGSVPPLRVSSPLIRSNGSSAAMYAPLFIGLVPPADELKNKILRRLKIRFRQGMIDEIKNLHDRKKLSWKRMEELGLEYRFISRFLRKKSNDKIPAGIPAKIPVKIRTKKELEEILANNIWHYAKRQMTWFRPDTRIHWLPRNSLSASLKLIKYEFSQK